MRFHVLVVVVAYVGCYCCCVVCANNCQIDVHGALMLSRDYGCLLLLVISNLLLLFSLLLLLRNWIDFGGGMRCCYHAIVGRIVVRCSLVGLSELGCFGLLIVSLVLLWCWRPRGGAPGNVAAGVASGAWVWGARRCVCA